MALLWLGDLAQRRRRLCAWMVLGLGRPLSQLLKRHARAEKPLKALAVCGLHVTFPAFVAG